MRPKNICGILLFFLSISVFILPAGARGTFGNGNSNALPNVTDIRIYNVTGESLSGRRTGGNFEDSGINTTYLLNQSSKTRYRFTFRIRNDGGSSWDIQGVDQLFHDGLDTSWNNGTIWYNVSGTRYEGGNFENGRIEWDTSQGGTLGTGEVMWAKYLVNISLTSSVSRFEEFRANNSGSGTGTSEDTGSYDYHTLNVTELGFLAVDLKEPPNDTVVVQNETFILNASATCKEGECGSVSMNPRYNESSVADTIIPRGSGKPFYVNSSKTKTCNSDLLQGETCFQYWHVNATGEFKSWHLVDSNFTSSFSEIKENDTEDSLVQINQALLIDLSFSNINFGSLKPGAQNRSAIGNANLSYNVTVDEDSESIDGLWTNASWLDQAGTDYRIGPTNMSFSTTNDISTETFYSGLGTYEKVAQNLSPGDIVNLFFWIDVPEGILKGEYNGTIYFKANSTR